MDVEEPDFHRSYYEWASLLQAEFRKLQAECAGMRKEITEFAAMNKEICDLNKEICDFKKEICDVKSALSALLESRSAPECAGEREPSLEERLERLRRSYC